MVFNSFIFILLFLPLTLAGWYLLNGSGRHRLADVFLIAMSCWFYGSFGRWNLPVLALSIAGNYIISSLMSSQEQEKGRVLLACGVVFNLLLLGFFKYGSGLEIPNVGKVMLPVGISFFTFSQISWLVDRFRRQTPHPDIREYILYVCYFPKLAEGPITCYEEVMTQLRDPDRRRFDAENLWRGMILFVIGMAKKVLIADVLAPVAAFGFSNVYYLDMQTVAVMVAAYAFQLYFDFSGFIDMARGVSRMLGTELPLNFDSPFREVSFGKFWQKWHMTLTRFMTRYVYIPLGGSRVSRARTCLNVMIVFMLSGIWHGTGWPYFSWGVVTGIMVVLFNIFLKDKVASVQSSVGRTMLRILTFVIFCFTLLFFGASGLRETFVLLRRFFVLTWPGFLYRAANCLNVAEAYPADKVISLLAPQYLNQAHLILLLALLTACIIIVSRPHNSEQISKTMPLTRRNGVLLGVLLAWCLISLSGVSTFVYFQY